MTMTMVGTIQVKTIHVRATRTPGKFCSRMSAEAIASTVCATAFPATQTTLRPRASQKAAEESTER